MDVIGRGTICFASDKFKENTVIAGATYPKGFRTANRVGERRIRVKEYDWLSHRQHGHRFPRYLRNLRSPRDLFVTAGQLSHCTVAQLLLSSLTEGDWLLRVTD